MRVRGFAVLTSWLALCAPVFGAGVGFQTAAVPDPPGAPLEVGIWYPADGPRTDQRLELFTQKVAAGAPVAGSGRPLVVISHGTGGSLSGHYDTAIALAEAGFVVAAPAHTGDTYQDQSRTLLLAERPRAIHAAIGYMLEDWSGRGAIDPGKVGVFGFSLGGFAALVAAGGVPGMAKVAPYCAGHPSVFTCQVYQRGGATDQGGPSGVGGDWIADRRIGAAVVAAPALGFTFSRDGLSGVTIPVQLWRAEDDHILPSPDYAEPVRDALPATPDYRVAAGADHFDFLAPCSAALASVAPAICQEAGGFDRAAFHEAFNRDVVSFFAASLNVRRGAD